jgi:hypothetical protein
MAKDKRLLIVFDADIWEGAVGNQAAFTVTGTRYKYVNGPLENTTYPVLSTNRPLPPSAGKTLTGTDLAAGTAVNVKVSTSLQLAPAGG